MHWKRKTKGGIYDTNHKGHGIRYDNKSRRVGAN